jgi:hypothetical protein
MKGGVPIFLGAPLCEFGKRQKLRALSVELFIMTAI